MIQVRICRDELGVRIDFLVETEDGDPYTEHMYVGEHIDMWDNEERMKLIAFRLVQESIAVLQMEVYRDRISKDSERTLK